MAEGPESMVWPTWRHRLVGARIFRWPAYNGFFVDFRNWYFGHWLMIGLGWFAFQVGSGVYEQAA